MKNTPLRLIPAFKDYVWGGTRLRTDFGKICDLDRIAESWELSCHKDGRSVIFGGEYDGQTLESYIAKLGNSVLGSNCAQFENFPVLVKLIDARDDLSVQVHPNNDYALAVEGEYGKTEMWYIVDCDEGAALLFGFKEEISKGEFARRIKDNTLTEVTRSVPVKKGDVFFIEAGTLHAIGKGILIAEIQQNSNTTYRIYDYGRVGADGSPRPLHIEKAIEVTQLSIVKERPLGAETVRDGYSERELARCEYFTAARLLVESKADIFVDDKSFAHLLILDGAAELSFDGEAMELKKGDSIFLPAGMGACKILGACDIILTKI